ncbi:MAG: hypothetical protein QXR76_06145 [Candidatus Bathyarchaeia archaeon]
MLIIIVSAATLLFSTMFSMWLSRFHNLHLPSLGTIRVIGVEAYGGNITTAQDEKIIDWGTVYPGTFTNRSVYIKSISNLPVTLNLTISNIVFQNSTGQNVAENPPIENPLSLTWDYNNTLLYPNDEIYVTLTLIMSSDYSFVNYLINNGVEKFGFGITIKAVPAE